MYIFKVAAKLKIHFCLKFWKLWPTTSRHIRRPGLGGEQDLGKNPRREHRGLQESSRTLQK